MEVSVPANIRTQNGAEYIKTVNHPTSSGIAIRRSARPDCVDTFPPTAPRFSRNLDQSRMK
jgi:hypothetical protein